MENRYKVELWTKEFETEAANNKTLNFDVKDESSLRIVSNQYEDIFSFLASSFPTKIVNLDLKGRTLNKEISEYLYSTSEEKRALIFSTSDQIEQKKILNNLINKYSVFYNNYSTNNLYITFGLLDYYDSNNRKEVKSAPLVFMPIEVMYNKEKDQYSIKQINKELFLNNNLISFLRKTKKIDISYPINSRFSVVEYLSFVANKVHLLRWSVNNGTFISDFDLSFRKIADDILLQQEKIANLALVKSISYYNSEFYSFNTNSHSPLNKKVMNILSIDNDEYQILQKVANRESLFIRTDVEENKYHLINATLSSFLLNNKKILITYNSLDEKEKFIKNLDPVLIPYFIDLNKENINKVVLIDRLNKFDTDYLAKDTLDSTTSQEILNNYYDIKNGFKLIINALRKKHAPFSLSLSDVIEKYYSLDNEMLDIQIPRVNEITSEILEEYDLSIKSFINTNKKLGCYYKDHPFYGFKTSSMMQEEFIPIKNAFFSLNEDLKKLRTINISLSKDFNLPYVNNLKLTKAILNILSVIELYDNYHSDFFIKENWNEVYENLALIIKKNSSINEFKENIQSLYGNNVFSIPNIYIERSELNKKLSKKEIKALRPYFSSNVTISLDTLRGFYTYNDELNNLLFEIENIRNRIPNCFKEFINDDVLDVSSTNKLEEACHIIRKSINYLHRNKIAFSYSHLETLKEKDQIPNLLEIRKNLQMLFNKILDNTNIIQAYFDTNIYQFATLDLDEYFFKTDMIIKDFISINDYLDFLVSLWKTNNVIKGLGNSLLKEKNYNLYEAMFYKRFYYDYAINLMNLNLNKKISTRAIFEHLEKYNMVDENRIKLFNSIIRNNYIESLRTQSIVLKRYEKGYLDEEKNNSSFMPLNKITNMAHESIYHKIPIILVPLKDVSLLLNSEQYHFDVNIILSDRKLKTKDTLTSLYRADQNIVFDNKLISNVHEEDYIDIYNVENFISASKRAFRNVELISKTYKNVPLSINRKDIYFKNHLYKKLVESGFEVARDVIIKDASIDFIVRMPSRKGRTCILINRLPYYSIESAKESIIQNTKLLENEGYSLINVFPFTYFKNEDDEYEKIKQEIINNSFKSPSNKTKIIKKKLSEVLFSNYSFPREYYFNIANKNSYSRRELFYMVLEKTAPTLKSEMLSLFPLDGELYLSILIRDNKIEVRDGFIYLKDKSINFKAYRNKDGRFRKLESVAKEEIIDGILRVVEYIKSIEDTTLIPLILSSLGHKTMNATKYEVIENILIDLVKEDRLILEEGVVSINKNYEEKIEQEIIKEDIKLIVRDE